MIMKIDRKIGYIYSFVAIGFGIGILVGSFFTLRDFIQYVLMGAGSGFCLMAGLMTLINLLFGSKK